MKTRYVAVAMLIVLALCLTSCARKQPSATGKKAYRVGVTLLTKSHPFYQELESAMRESAAKHDIMLNVQSAEFDMKDQQAQIENFITQRMDALVVCPVDSDTIGGAIKEANRAGIPVFTADIAANDGEVVCHIASDNVMGGRIAGQYMAKLLNGKGKIIIIDHPKVMSVRDRTKGFVEAISRYPGIKIIARPPGDGERVTSMNVMETMLQSHPEITGVFAINDSTALGALSALRQAKRDDIIMVGYDADPEAQTEILKGSPLKADAVQYPREIGSTTILMVAKYLAGEQVPKRVPIKVGIFDKTSSKPAPKEN
ncbi:MAG TPA: substrate-binding domain-containing protein [Armatimonadota bacterium]|nr:substrate-binding domain-containing protein [Armatimonadota bacterium]